MQGWFVILKGSTFIVGYKIAESKFFMEEINDVFKEILEYIC